MKKTVYSFLAARSLRALALAALAVVSLAGARADNSVTLALKPFSICPGGDKVVELCLNNPEDVSSLEANMVLPEGLTITSFVINTDRIDRQEHTFSFKPRNADSTEYRLVILATQQENIIGSEGALCSLTFHAAPSFFATGKITVRDMVLTNSPNDHLGIPSLTYTPDSFDVKVSPLIGSLQLDEKLEVCPGTPTTVAVALNNDVDVFGMQLNVTLPAGMSFVTKANGKLLLTYGDRLPGDFQVSAGNVNPATNTVTMIVSSMSHESVSGKSGMLFSFGVNASDSLAAASEIVISKAKLSVEQPGAGASDYDVTVNLDSATIAIVNLYQTCYLPAVDEIASLNNELQTAVSTIDSVYTLVAADSAIVATKAEIAAKIAGLKVAVEDAYAAGKVAAFMDSLAVEAPAIRAAIATLLADAEAANAEALKAAEVQTAYATAMSYVDSLAVELQAAVDTIAVRYPNVVTAETVVAKEDEIKSLIGEFATVIADAYAAGTIVNELPTYTAHTAELRVAIADLLVLAHNEHIATGITAVGAGRAAVVAVYDLTGHKVAQPAAHGLYIVKYATGETRKVLVK